MARPRAVRSVSRPAARRLGEANVARSRSRNRRDCVHHAQDRTANRAAAGATARRLLGSIAGERRSRTLSSSRTRQARSARPRLSNQFREILVDAGLVEPLPRGHKSTGKGRDQAREASEISFHSLRHSAVTMLKAAVFRISSRARLSGTRARQCHANTRT